MALSIRAMASWRYCASPFQQWCAGSGRPIWADMPPALSVVRAHAVMSSRAFGMTLGEALFSDGLTARFHVLCRDPPSVRVIADRQLPEHERAVERWMDEHTGRHAA